MGLEGRGARCRQGEGQLSNIPEQKPKKEMLRDFTQQNNDPFYLLALFPLPIYIYPRIKQKDTLIEDW